MHLGVPLRSRFYLTLTIIRAVVFLRFLICGFLD